MDDKEMNDGLFESFCRMVLRPEVWGRGAPPLCATPEWLYFLYDATGVIIYVGRTSNPYARLSRHKREFAEFVGSRLWQVPPGVSSREVEHSFIVFLRPSLNKIHADDDNCRLFELEAAEEGKVRGNLTSLSYMMSRFFDAQDAAAKGQNNIERQIGSRNQRAV